jgi:uncharacterized membrane protein
MTFLFMIMGLLIGDIIGGLVVGNWPMTFAIMLGQLSVWLSLWLLRELKLFS